MRQKYNELKSLIISGEKPQICLILELFPQLNGFIEDLSSFHQNLEKASGESEIVKLSLFFHLLENDYKTGMRLMELSGGQKEKIIFLLRNLDRIALYTELPYRKFRELIKHPYYCELKKLALYTGVISAEMANDLEREEHKARKRLRIITLSGGDLIKAGIPPGKHYDELINEVAELSARGKIRDKGQAISWAKKKYFQEIVKRSG